MPDLASRPLVAICIAVLAAGMTSTARADNAWHEIRASVFGSAELKDGTGVVKLVAPNRPTDMRDVPITVSAEVPNDKSIKTITVLIDNNPTPVVARYHMGQKRTSVTVKANYRVDRQSDVRAVVETADGQHFITSQLVKFAGGQSSCSAPPQGDPADIAANMGKMQLTPKGVLESVSTVRASAVLKLSHPNHTGMVMDQITLLYTPMKMVSEIDVKLGDETVFTAEGSIALSQDPMIEFDYRRNGSDIMSASFKDTDGGSWQKQFSIGPQG